LGDIKFERKVQVLLWFLVFLFLHSIFIIFCLSVPLLSFFLFLFHSLLQLPQSFLFLPFQDSIPVSADIFRDPILDFESGDTLHAKNLETNVIFARVGIGYSFNVDIVTASCVFDHGINGCEFFWTFGTVKMFGLLVMMEDDLVLEFFFTVETEGFET
jgi:hypothetical protein